MSVWYSPIVGPSHQKSWAVALLLALSGEFMLLFDIEEESIGSPQCPLELAPLARDCSENVVFRSWSPSWVYSLIALVPLLEGGASLSDSLPKLCRVAWVDGTPSYCDFFVIILWQSECPWSDSRWHSCCSASCWWSYWELCSPFLLRAGVPMRFFRRPNSISGCLDVWLCRSYQWDSAWRQTRINKSDHDKYLSLSVIEFRHWIFGADRQECSWKS